MRKKLPSIQGTALPIGENVHELLCRVVEKRLALLTVHHERGYHGGDPLFGQQRLAGYGVAQDREVQMSSLKATRLLRLNFLQQFVETLK
jgi:hypothetical protein